MDRSRIIYLVKETFVQNALKVYESTIEKRKVFAQIDSVSGNEWFEGGRNGLNPELRLRMRSADYQGEQIAEYNGVEYEIYRTYIARNDFIDLYVQRRIGNG